mmetsp:Transcript_53901/g.121034  ORF Transcript_53901/g.121034 Transcript_53901/m.121034 type:complete len:287 (+) Transcript_53901:50-910(+)
MPPVTADGIEPSYFAAVQERLQKAAASEGSAGTALPARFVDEVASALEELHFSFTSLQRRLHAMDQATQADTQDLDVTFSCKSEDPQAPLQASQTQLSKVEGLLASHGSRLQVLEGGSMQRAASNNTVAELAIALRSEFAQSQDELRDNLHHNLYTSLQNLDTTLRGEIDALRTEHENMQKVGGSDDLKGGLFNLRFHVERNAAAIQELQEKCQHCSPAKATQRFSMATPRDVLNCGEDDDSQYDWLGFLDFLGSDGTTTFGLATVPEGSTYPAQRHAVHPDFECT